MSIKWTIFILCMIVSIAIVTIYNYTYTPQHNRHEYFTDTSNEVMVPSAMDIVSDQLSSGPLSKNQDPMKIYFPKPIFNIPVHPSPSLAKPTLDTLTTSDNYKLKNTTTITPPDAKDVFKKLVKIGDSLESGDTYPIKGGTHPIKGDTHPIKGDTIIKPITSVKVENFTKNVSESTLITRPSHLNARKLCKFITSSRKEAKCPPKYSLYTGATFIQRDSTHTCDGKPTNNTGVAKAVAILKNNKVVRIKVIHGGFGYSVAPHIYLERHVYDLEKDGRNASAIATVKQDMVDTIDIMDTGDHYTFPPKVWISKPNVATYCHLCCNLG